MTNEHIDETRDFLLSLSSTISRVLTCQTTKKAVTCLTNSNCSNRSFELKLSNIGAIELLPMFAIISTAILDEPEMYHVFVQAYAYIYIDAGLTKIIFFNMKRCSKQTIKCW